MTIRDMKPGDAARIEAVGGEGALRQHFLDMGVIPGVEIQLVRLAPMGDPMELRLHGYELTLRLAEAEQIRVTPAEPDVGAFSRKVETAEQNGAALAEPAPKPAWTPRKKKAAHPALGEPGVHHDKATENPLPKDHVLTFALVGNQNSGKSTLFNQLTGANQHVGNFPGVTVDRRTGAIRGQQRTLITDLPGIYSMSPYSGEELVSRDFVLREKPDAVINIVDATSIERGLYLTMQLLEMGRPMVVALNMMDELTGNGGTVDINEMEAMLGVPVVPISAAKNQGIEELVTHAVHVARYQEKPLRQDFCSQDDNGGAVHRCLHAAASLIEDHANKAGLPLRFAAGKAIEGDSLILGQLDLDANERETLEHIALQLENERGFDRCAALAEMRYAFIGKVCGRCVTRPAESREHLRSQRIDRLLTGKYTALPMFILIMGLVFWLTFGLIGPWLQDLLETGIGALGKAADGWLTAGNVNPVLHGLVINGLFEGVGSVLSFLPLVVVLFFFLSLLEDSGYIARVAFFMDRLLRRIGLSGRSIVPLLIGFGCSVPAVMATRTLPSERDRRMTILLTPFMSCTAKLPIYAFFVNAFFPRYAVLIIVALYVLGVVTGVLAALLYRKTLFSGEAVPFVMELPNYRMPGLRTTAQLVWEKARDFLQRAFTVILIATLAVWFLKSFDFRMNLVADDKDSILAVVSGWLAPLFAPMGLGRWQIVTSLISGFMAKESVVSVLQVLFGAEGVTAVITPLAAGALLIFSLLYTPCVAAIAAVRREMGRRWAAAMVVWQCAAAWLMAMAFYQLGWLATSGISLLTGLSA